MNNYYEEKLKQVKSDMQQYEAYRVDDSTVVIAGPGSGKTTVLTLKIMKLLRENVQEPRGLACVTFSKEAVREFKQRLQKLGYKRRNNVFLGTVHAFCISEVLSPFAHLFPKYKIPLPIRIISDKNKRKLFKEVVYDLGFDNMQPPVRIDEMDRERRLGIDGISAVEIQSYDIALKVAREFEHRLYKSGYVDYESIVNCSTALIQGEEYVRKCLSAKFPWILIDEYQDLGRPLHEMILALYTKTDIKIFAVGDPDQSIYGFQGAVPDYLLELYGLPEIQKKELKTNYRSNQDIINASELVLNSKRGYIAGTRQDESADFIFVTCEEEMDQQYNLVAEKVIAHYRENGTLLEEIAVLVKNKDEIKALSSYLEDNGIPYYVSKHEFDRSDLVKWLESCAAWTIDNMQESFSDIYDFWEGILNSHGKRVHPHKRILEKTKLYEILAKNKVYETNIAHWINAFLCDLNIKEILSGSTIYPDELENIDNLLKVVESELFSSYGIEKFCKLGKPENQVTLTTRHSSKGLEFEVVVLLGMEEGNFPDYRSLNDQRKLEEEHRICFVCISRAKKVCILVRSQKLSIKTKHGLWKKAFEESRFWKALVKRYGDTSDKEKIENIG